MRLPTSSSLTAFLLLLLLPAPTTPTPSPTNLFHPPLTLTTLPNGTTQYQYPDGTPLNAGASSSFTPFPLALTPNSTAHLLSPHLTLHIPILFAATAFESLYRAVFEHAAAELWNSATATTTSKRVAKIALGQLQLVFSSEGGGPLEWHVVAAFAWGMWQAAKRGFTAG
ncbi:MAG: hypothetical protein Q9195_009071, partial [Heterodermia aff. obscurata]